MEFCLFDSGDGGEHNDLGIVKISNIFGVQGAFFFGTELFDRVPIVEATGIQQRLLTMTE